MGAELSCGTECVSFTEITLTLLLWPGLGKRWDRKWISLVTVGKLNQAGHSSELPKLEVRPVRDFLVPLQMDLCC